MLVVVAAAASGTGCLLRHRETPGSSANSGTYLLDVAGLLIAIAAAVFEIRSSVILLPAKFPGAHRRSLLLLILGMPLMLLGCLLASMTSRVWPFAIQVGGSLLIPIGLAFLIGGGVSLAWHHGVDAAGGRIEVMNEQDW